jgi:hypothetical protein
MNLQIALALILIHFIADFLCQTDSMALNKSKSIYWLTVHVITYTIVLSIAIIIMAMVFNLNFKTAIIYALLNGALHFITDFFTSKLTSRLAKLPSKHWFFVAIGADQLIHYYCLMISFYYFF